MANIRTFERDGVFHAHPEYRRDLAVAGSTFHEAVGHAVAALPAVFGIVVHGPDAASVPAAKAPEPPSKPAKTKPAD